MRIVSCLFLTAVLTALPLGGVCEAQTVVSQSFEQSIVTPDGSGSYLWLPVQESAPEGRVVVVWDGYVLAEMNVRMAREVVDYYVALDLRPYRDLRFKVCVRNVPAGSVCFSKLVQNDDADYALVEERYRPLYHHTPRRGWMNDPNGMFYRDGVWHLYYQYNPYGSMWGNMHWGHSTSRDLIGWKAEPVALSPDAWGTMFSGSCVVDDDAVVAMYTSSRPTPFGGDVQAQCMAVSRDGGMTFTKYEGNPVLTSSVPDFRDPKVFWNEDAGVWNMILAAGQEMRIYSSSNLRDWKEESRFGLGYGCHEGVWECPDLFPLSGGAAEHAKWVLVCNINPGGPFGGSGTQYFIGRFDGKTFTVDDGSRYTDGKALWMDYGKDHYAAVSWSGAPDGRNTMIAWMSNWQYANDVPTKQFRSANSIARDLGLFEYEGETYVSVVPSKEMLAARGRKVKQPTEACEIVVDVRGSAAIELSNDRGELVTMRYDAAKQTFSMDRTRSGEVGFSDAFPCVTTAPTYGGIKQFRLYADRCSIEAFDADGKMAMTNLVFPSEPYNKIRVKGGKATIYNLTPQGSR